jgi:N-acetylmuramoyl-L-alanine amidase
VILIFIFFAMRKITEIIVHCSATPEGRDVSANEIDRWHRNRGFAQIGYHYVVRLNGVIETGRPVDKIGAHCLGHNANSIGVCYVGGYAADGHTAKDTRTAAQKQALRNLLRELLNRYPGATVHSHRDFAAKACPCFDATKEYANLQRGGDNA